MPVTFCPDDAGNPSFLTGSGFARGHVLVLHLEHACFLMDAGAALASQG